MVPRSGDPTSVVLPRRGFQVDFDAANRPSLAHLHIRTSRTASGGISSAGLDWQGTIACARSSEVFEHLIRTVDDLQATIAELCGAIFQMRSPIGRLSDLRQWIHNAIGGLTEDRET